LELDAKAHTLVIHPYGRGGVKYSWQMPDADHLTLTTAPPEPPKGKAKTPAKPAAAFTADVITLTRTPVAAHYPLLDRGFHLVNEWGLER
jgi:hypothetical protein